jgi:hypothetical protein
MKFAAKDMVKLISANSHVDFAAANSIELCTEQGASLKIEGGNITFACPGVISIKASSKSYSGPTQMSYGLPQMPKSAMEPRRLEFNLRLADTPGAHGHVLANTPWKIAIGDKPDGLALIDEEHVVLEGISDSNGKLNLSAAQQDTLAKAYCAHPSRTWLVFPGACVQVNVATESDDWTDKDKALHALNAADFSPSLHNDIFSDGATDHTQYAKQALDSQQNKSIYPKIKAS